MPRSYPSALNQLRVRHFRLLDTLAEEGSLRKAAKALHMSQPAASGMLQEVERAFGSTLFTRTRKGVAVNATGKIALGRVRTLLSELGMVAEELQSPETSPVLRIGALQHAFYGPLQELLPEFLARTDCRLLIREDSGPGLMSRLEQNDVDCIIGRMPAVWIDSFDRRGFFYRPLYEFETCVVAASTHPLTRRRKVSLEQASKFPWILSRSGSNTRYVLGAAFAAAGLDPPEIRIETPSFIFSLPLLATGNCLTIAPREPALQQQRLGLARILPIRLPKLLTPVAFVAQRSAMQNPNVQLFWECARRSVASRHARTSGSAYAKFATEHLPAAASRIESNRVAKSRRTRPTFPLRPLRPPDRDSAPLRLELPHILHQSLHPLDRHGVVYRSAHAADGAVAFELEHAALFGALQKLAVEL